jgi:DNA-dependent RNA polymerase auxiliary subunit epsilon
VVVRSLLPQDVYAVIKYSSVYYSSEVAARVRYYIGEDNFFIRSITSISGGYSLA